MPCLGARKKSKTAGGNAKQKVNAVQLQQDLDRLKTKVSQTVTNSRVSKMKDLYF
jgi:hypothetical protein